MAWAEADYDAPVCFLAGCIMLNEFMTWTGRTIVLVSVLLPGVGMAAGDMAPPEAHAMPAPPATQPAELRGDPVRDAISNPQAAALPGAEAVEKVATGYKFIEGPAGDAEGSVCFTDLPTQRVLRLDPGPRAVTTVRENTGAANGLAFDAAGALVACEGVSRQVTRTIGSGAAAKTTVLADRFEEKKLNSPNDLVIDAAGGIYFTDPRYGPKKDLEQPVMGVYYLSPEGRLSRVIATRKLPNGIGLSPEGKTLYVADNGAGQVFAYEITDAGKLGAERPLAGVNGCDGLCVDLTGRLFVAGKEGIVVLSPAGQVLGTIPVPEVPSNCTLVGPVKEGVQMLYITARTSLYRVPVPMVESSVVPVPAPAPAPAPGVKPVLPPSGLPGLAHPPVPTPLLP